MKIFGDREAKVFSEEANNTFLDLHNSSDYKKAEFRIFVTDLFLLIPSLKTTENILTSMLISILHLPVSEQVQDI